MSKEEQSQENNADQSAWVAEDIREDALGSPSTCVTTGKKKVSIVTIEAPEISMIMQLKMSLLIYFFF